MEKWKNKKVIRGFFIALIAVVTMGVAIVNTKISPADSEDKARTVAEGSRSEKTSENKKGNSSKKIERKGQGDAASENLQGTEEDSQETRSNASERDASNPQDNNKTTSDAGKSSPGEPSKDKPNPGKTKEEDGKADTTQGNATQGGSASGAASQGGDTQAPAGNEPQPVKDITCSVSISCSAISGNGVLTANGHPEVEAYATNPTILGTASYTLKEGATAYDILQQACSANGIHLDAEYNRAYKTYYVKGINYLYEFYAGYGSGWMYQVNGASPSVGASSYKLCEGDVVTWYYVTK